jgi:hypothetical protein
MAHSVRLVVAVLVAPVVTSVLLITGGTLLTGCLGYGCLVDTIGAIMGIGVMAGVLIGVPATVIGGLPAHRFLIQTRRTHAGFYVLAGGLVGLPTAIAAVVFTSPGALTMSLGGWGFACAFCAVAGALSALLFWFIRRPDRDAANPVTRAA